MNGHPASRDSSFPVLTSAQPKGLATLGTGIPDVGHVLIPRSDRGPQDHIGCPVPQFAG